MEVFLGFLASAGQLCDRRVAFLRVGVSLALLQGADQGRFRLVAFLAVGMIFILLQGTGQSRFRLVAFFGMGVSLALLQGTGQLHRGFIAILGVGMAFAFGQRAGQFRRIAAVRMDVLFHAAVGLFLQGDGGEDQSIGRAEHNKTRQKTNENTSAFFWRESVWLVALSALG